MSFNENERNFLLELEQLSRKYKLKIQGYGCCGSLMLDEMKEGELVEEAGYGESRDSDVVWVSPVNEYDWEEYHKSIVKKEEKP